MEKVKESKCTAYDCEYVVLAEVLKSNLITKDKEILKFSVVHDLYQCYKYLLKIFKFLCGNKLYQ